MKTRIELLKDLVTLSRSLKDIQSDLSQYPWDVDEALIIITKADFSNVAQSYLDNKISVDELENWANAIECREDIDFEHEQVKQSVFELANPVINGEINRKQVQNMIAF
jgi:hypothetical protein